MFQRLSTDFLNWIIIIGVILFVLEITFFNGGLIFTAVISGIFIYVGWKNFSHLWGKICFWIALISLIFSILNMMAVRFLVLVAIGLFIVHYLKAKDQRIEIKPEFNVLSDEIGEEVIRVKPIFDHQIFGDQETFETAYAWRDINIHGGFGDRVIDLSNTVLPDDTVVISIRHIFGHIEIYVPYEVEVSIHHSVLYGKANILGNHHMRLMNETISYKTKEYDLKQQRVKIITSLISGDIEVKRI